ncbi:MAG: OmpA family protein [Pseudomonadota bacterium]
MSAERHSGPVLPRRAFVAAGLSAVLAGSLVGLGWIGGASRIETGVFQFSRGLSFAAGEEDRLRALLARALTDERIHVTILGHTGDAGDAAANLALSEERAALAAAMAAELGVSPERVLARGLGGASPLARESGESDRAYQARLARVEASLQMRR